LKGKIEKNYHFVQLLDNSTIISNLGLSLDTKKIVFLKITKTTSASLQTCRRRLVDTPQTLTQTLLLTLIQQDGF